MKGEEQPTLQNFLEAKGLESFRVFEPYQNLGLPDLVNQLRVKYQELCIQNIQASSSYLKGEESSREGGREQDPEVSKLDELVIQEGSSSFYINGVIHGLIGGGTASYRELIRKTLRESPELLLFEAGFNHLYGEKGMTYLNMPDFAVLGLIDSLKKGLDAGRLLPLLLFDLVRELFSAMPEDSGFHSLDQEVRRGIEGILPTPLEVEWDRIKPRPFFSLEDYPNIVRRSAYMAAFAREISKKRGLLAVRLVVGDFHLTEVAYFLNFPREIPADIQLLAAKTTFEKPFNQKVNYLKENLIHNTIAGCSGFVAMLPYLALWLTFQHYFISPL